MKNKLLIKSLLFYFLKSLAERKQYLGPCISNETLLETD